MELELELELEVALELEVEPEVEVEVELEVEVEVEVEVDVEVEVELDPPDDDAESDALDASEVVVAAAPPELGAQGAGTSKEHAPGSARMVKATSASPGDRDALRGLTSSATHVLGRVATWGGPHSVATLGTLSELYDMGRPAAISARPHVTDVVARGANRKRVAPPPRCRSTMAGPLRPASPSETRVR